VLNHENQFDNTKTLVGWLIRTVLHLQKGELLHNDIALSNTRRLAFSESLDGVASCNVFLLLLLLNQYWGKAMCMPFADIFRTLNILSISILSLAIIFNYAISGYDLKVILASQ